MEETILPCPLLISGRKWEKLHKHGRNYIYFCVQKLKWKNPHAQGRNYLSVPKSGRKWKKLNENGTCITAVILSLPPHIIPNTPSNNEVKKHNTQICDQHID